MRRAGLPATRAWSGTSRMTTAPAPTVAKRPTSVPATNTAPAPTEQPSRSRIVLTVQSSPPARVPWVPARVVGDLRAAAEAHAGIDVGARADDAVVADHGALAHLGTIPDLRALTDAGVGRDVRAGVGHERHSAALASAAD